MVRRIVPDRAAAERLAVIDREAFTRPEPGWPANDFLAIAERENAAIFADPGLSAGMICVQQAADEAEILTLGVRPCARRCGLGRRLLRAAEDWARERGAETMFLEVADDNTPAILLYAGAGYVQMATRSGYYLRPEGIHVAALVLSKTL